MRCEIEAARDDAGGVRGVMLGRRVLGEDALLLGAEL